MSFSKSFNQATHSNRKCNLGSVEALAGQTRGAIRVVLELPACRQAGLVTFSFKRKSDK